MRYTVLKIFEEDYGCEGIPDDAEPMCSVLLRDNNNMEKWVKLPDSYLTGNNILEGDSIELDM